MAPQSHNIVCPPLREARPPAALAQQLCKQLAQQGASCCAWRSGSHHAVISCGHSRTFSSGWYQGVRAGPTVLHLKLRVSIAAAPLPATPCCERTCCAESQPIEVPLNLDWQDCCPSLQICGMNPTGTFRCVSRHTQDPDGQVSKIFALILQGQRRVAQARSHAVANETIMRGVASKPEADHTCKPLPPKCLARWVPVQCVTSHHSGCCLHQKRLRDGSKVNLARLCIQMRAQ